MNANVKEFVQELCLLCKWPVRQSEEDSAIRLTLNIRDAELARDLAQDFSDVVELSFKEPRASGNADGAGARAVVQEVLVESAERPRNAEMPHEEQR